MMDIDHRTTLVFVLAVIAVYGLLSLGGSALAAEGCAPGADIVDLADGCKATITAPADTEILLRLGDKVQSA